ncbi:hypothetical protein TWF281_006634 [Arthrobotrys megalospora]
MTIETSPDGHSSIGPISMSTMTEFLKGMPKCELNVHLEGTMESSHIKIFAVRNGLAFPDIFQPSGLRYKDFRGPQDFLNVYQNALSVIRTGDDFKDLLIDYLRKAQSMRVLYVEFYFEPQVHLERGVSLDMILKGLKEGFEAMRNENIKAQMVLCFLSDRPVQEADDILTMLLKDENKALVVGIGLNNNGNDQLPFKFRRIFERARAAGLKTSMHCDIDMENSVDFLRLALLSMRVDRIDGGTDILDQESLLQEALTRDMGFTCCPISKSYLRGNCVQPEQIMFLLDQGVKVSIHSDDPGFMVANLVDNLDVMEKKTGMVKKEAVKFQENAILTSWAPDDLKLGMLNSLYEHFKSQGGNLGDLDGDEERDHEFP